MCLPSGCLGVASHFWRKKGFGVETIEGGSTGTWFLLVSKLLLQSPTRHFCVNSIGIESKNITCSFEEQIQILWVNVIFQSNK